MKRIIYLFSGLFILLVVSSCKKMDSTYEQFIVPGSMTYVGKATKAIAQSGNQRVKVSWPRGSDPNIVKARIYWDNFADSIEIDVPANADTISHVFENLEEKTYSFIIKTFDNKGNVSIPVELISRSYGANYAAGLQNRSVLSSEVDNAGNLKILWARADVSSGAFETEIKYATLLGPEKVFKIKSKDSVTTITDYKPGSIAKFSTKFLPDSIAIDTFYSTSQTLNIAAKLVKTGWTATANSAEPAAQLPNGGPAQLTIDNRADTYWHTNHTNAQGNYPYWLAYDFKTALTVTRIELTSRVRFFGEDFTEFTVQGSDNGTTWANYGLFVQKETDVTQSYFLTGFKHRYLRIYMTKGTTIHSHLAEFSAFGY
ncbi:MAG: hypothetical protein EOO88_11845 [Pedobacter sp.]|nr:MAG: hypothetical protein EOO88_11845 [Pedobacter sp.]